MNEQQKAHKLTILAPPKGKKWSVALVIEEYMQTEEGSELLHILLIPDGDILYISPDWMMILKYAQKNALVLVDKFGDPLEEGFDEIGDYVPLIAMRRYWKKDGNLESADDADVYENPEWDFPGNN